MSESIIIPYQGYDDMTLSMDYDEVRKRIKEKHIRFQTEFRPNKGWTPVVPWHIINTEIGVSFSFANKKMFEMSFERGFEGALNNGIRIGMKMDEARKIDPKLVFCDDEDEYFSSPDGYWIEDSLITGEVEGITIFIPEILDTDKFFTYEWCL